MIYSQASEYGFRALTHLALHPGQPIPAKEIAGAAAVPPHFLAKILQQLARAGMLKSYRGPTGGFLLARAPEEITLLDIVDVLEGITQYKRCAVGLADCSDEMPCPMHESWKALREQVLSYLRNRTVADLGKALRRKLELLAGAAAEAGG